MSSTPAAWSRQPTSPPPFPADEREKWVCPPRQLHNHHANVFPSEMSKPGIDQLWNAHLKKNHKTTQCWACTHCIDRKIFSSADDLWRHCREDHKNQVPANEAEQRRYRIQF